MRYRARLTLLLAIMLVGCFRWPEQRVSPVTAVEQERPDLTRIIRHDSSVVELHQVSVEGDSLVGKERYNGNRVAIAISDVSSLAIRKWDWLEFGGFMAMLAGLVVLAGVNSGCCY